jgi:hypothetical protein
MMGPSNRFAAVLYALIGVGLFAIAYSGVGAGGHVAYALRILLATLTVIFAGHALLRRDVPLLLMAGGLAAWSVDAFNPQRILVYVGIILFLGGFFLMRKHSTTSPRDTGG